MGRARNRSGIDYMCCVLISSHPDYSKAYDDFEMRFHGMRLESKAILAIFKYSIYLIKAYYVLVRLNLFLYYHLLFQLI